MVAFDDALRETLAGRVAYDDVEGVLARVTLRDVAEEWLRAMRLDDADVTDADRWAVELWLCASMLLGSRERVRQGVLALVDAAAADVELAWVGAGPMENGLCPDEADVAWLEDECTRSPALRTAASSMWIASRWPADLVARVEHAVGQPLPRPVA